MCLCVPTDVGVLVPVWACQHVSVRLGNVCELWSVSVRVSMAVSMCMYVSVCVFVHVPSCIWLGRWVFL